MKPYFAIVLFAVPHAVAERFISINQQAALRYKQLGAEGTEILQLTDGAAKYGCLGLAGAMTTSADETVFMVIDRFHDKQDFQHIDALAGQDAACAALFSDLTSIIDVARSIRLEFESAGLTPPASHVP